MRVGYTNNTNPSVISNKGESALERERKVLVQINQRLRKVYLQDFPGSEEQRALLESKFREIEDVLEELNRCLKFANTLEQSSNSKRVAELIDRFNKTIATIGESQALHQRRVSHVQGETKRINIASLEMSREISNIDQQLSPQPPVTSKSFWDCENCLIS